MQQQIVSLSKMHRMSKTSKYSQLTGRHPNTEAMGPQTLTLSQTMLRSTGGCGDVQIVSEGRLSLSKEIRGGGDPASRSRQRQMCVSVTCIRSSAEDRVTSVDHLSKSVEIIPLLRLTVRLVVMHMCYSLDENVLQTWCPLMLVEFSE